MIMKKIMVCLCCISVVMSCADSSEVNDSKEAIKEELIVGSDSLTTEVK
jgi:hypothetical protein